MIDDASPVSRDMSSLPMLRCVLVIAVTWVYFALRRWYSQWLGKKPFPELPMPPTTSPLGHLVLFQRMFKEPELDDKVEPRILKYTNEYGQVGIWVLRRTLLVTHYEDARTVLAAEYFRKIPTFLVQKHVRMFLGDKNIGLLEGREWRLHRSTILRSLSPASTLEAARGGMIDVAQTFTASLTNRVASRDDPSSPLIMDLEPLMKMISIDIFSRTNLSVDLGCCRTLRASPIAEAFDFLLDSFKDRMLAPMNPWNHFYAIPTARNLRHEKEHNLIRSFLYNLIQERKNARMKAGFKGQHQDVLSNMLQANHDAKTKVKDSHEEEEHEPFDFDESMDDTLMALLFAGYDTTSITLMYAFFCVAQNPEIEKKCLDEILTVFEQCEDLDGSIKHLDPKHLVYCRGVLLETLRLYPPAGITTRFLKRPIKLRGGFVAPQGCAVIVPIEIIQRSERHFERPTEFIPERWVQRMNKTFDGNVNWEERPDKADLPSCGGCENVGGTASIVGPANRSAFLAFSSGARSCPGSKFALQEAVLVFAILLKQLKFESLPDYVLKPVRKGVVQHPEGGLPMRITIREEI
jgi:cytochrome P450